MPQVNIASAANPLAAWRALEGPLNAFLAALGETPPSAAGGKSLCAAHATASGDPGSHPTSRQRSLTDAAQELLWRGRLWAASSAQRTLLGRFSEQLLSCLAAWLRADDVYRARIACTDWREALGAHLTDILARWQQLLRPGYLDLGNHACGSEDSDAAVWSVARGMVHLQGRVTVPQHHMVGFVRVAMLPREARPEKSMIFMQSKSGVWGNVLLEVRVDGTVWLRPPCSSWLAAIWPAVGSDVSRPVNLTPHASSSSSLALTVLDGCSAHLMGVLSSNHGNCGPGIHMATLPRGLLGSGFRAAVFQQASLHGQEPGHLMVDSDCRVIVSVPPTCINVCLPFYIGGSYAPLRYESEFIPELDESHTTVGLAITSELAYLQGQLALVMRGPSLLRPPRGRFVHVATLPREVWPVRTLVLELHGTGPYRPGAQNDARLEIHTDGTLWLRPVASVWLTATWRRNPPSP